ncbi:hypothetical protein H5U98_02175 [Mycolicibacterium boenickei]|nr:hypothetical protein [Mycolicibacterium boenickei]UNC00281.1 hypothetical protein H5U98_02175 [Mycolicibacterium boenickei]
MNLAAVGVITGALSVVVSGWSLFYSASERRWIRVDRLLTLADRLDDEDLKTELRKDAVHLARCLYLRERRVEVRMMRTFTHRSHMLNLGAPSLIRMIPGRRSHRETAAIWTGFVAIGLVLVVAAAWPGSSNPHLAPWFGVATLTVAGLQFYFTVARGFRFPRRVVQPEALFGMEASIRSEAAKAWPPHYIEATD